MPCGRGSVASSHWRFAMIRNLRSLLLPVSLVAACQAPADGTFALRSTGPIAGSCNLDSPLTIADGGIANNHLAHPNITVHPGAGLSGGGTVPLGTTTSLAIASLGVTNAMLEGKIDNSKLLTSSLTVIPGA